MVEIMRETDPTSPSIKQLGALHSKLLPTSLISRVGYSFSEEAYRYCVGSSHELIFTAYEEDAVLGAAWVSLEPDALPSRLFFYTALLPRLVVRPRLLLKCFASKLAQSDSTQTLLCTPELVAVFTDVQERGRGIGHSLLMAVEEELKARGFSRYALRTIDSSCNQAIQFYERGGFETSGFVNVGGVRYRLMLKNIANQR